jgi:hypothetical protein
MRKLLLLLVVSLQLNAYPYCAVTTQQPIPLPIKAYVRHMCAKNAPYKLWIYLAASAGVSILTTGACCYTFLKITGER